MQYGPSQKVTIDAAGKVLGRIAADVAKTLMGKKRADYTPRILSDIQVTVVNAGKIKMREDKLKTVQRMRYSGYPSGVKKETLGDMNTRLGPAAALKHAITRMLPTNNLRPHRLKNLIIER